MAQPALGLYCPICCVYFVNCWHILHWDVCVHNLDYLRSAASAIIVKVREARACVPRHARIGCDDLRVVNSSKLRDVVSYN